MDTPRFVRSFVGFADWRHVISWATGIAVFSFSFSFLMFRYVGFPTDMSLEISVLGAAMFGGIYSVLLTIRSATDRTIARNTKA